MRRIAPILALGLLFLTLAACARSKGSVSEAVHEGGCVLEFTQWGDRSSHPLALDRNDVLQVEIVCESGGLALDIRDKNGVEAYTGNGLDTGTFTVKIPETGEYAIVITGDHATGRLEIKKLSK